MAARVPLERVPFARACAGLSVASLAVAVAAAIHPAPGWLVVVGGLSFAVLTACMAGLTVLLEHEERDTSSSWGPERAFDRT